MWRRMRWMNPAEKLLDRKIKREKKGFKKGRKK
jgi:hypothetical protein